MDVSKPRGNRIWLGDDKIGFWQEVVFENLPHYCEFCKKLGHAETDCFIKNPELKKEKKKSENLQKHEDMTTMKDGISNSLTWKKKMDTSVPTTTTMNNKVTFQGGEEEGWQIQKRKNKNRRKEAREEGMTEASQKKDSLVSHNLEIPVISSSTMGAKLMGTSCLQGLSLAAASPVLKGIALTPLNPLFVSQSSILKTNLGGQPSEFALQSGSSLPLVEVEKEKDNFIIPPAQTSEARQLQHPVLSTVSDKGKETASSANFQKGVSSLGNGQISCSSNLEIGFQPLFSSGIETQPLIGAESQFQPQLSLISGPHKLSNVSKDGNQPLFLEELQIQPTISNQSGPHGVVFERQIGIQPPTFSYPHGGGSHVHFSGNSIEIQPLSSKELQFQPPFSISSEARVINCEEIIQPLDSCEGTIKGSIFISHNSQLSSAYGPKTLVGPVSLTKHTDPNTCNYSNIGLDNPPNLFLGRPEKSIAENSFSSGPIFVDDIISPNANIVTNSMGQIFNEEGTSAMGQAMAQGNKVKSPFNILHIQSLLLSYISDRGVKVRPMFHKGLIAYFSLLEDSFDGSWEVSWFIIQKYLFKYFKESNVATSKKMRRVLHSFFQEATHEEWPLSNTEDLGLCHLNQEDSLPLVEDALSDTDGG